VLLVPAGLPLAGPACGRTPQRSSGRSDDNGTVLVFVAAGTGIALVPELALDGHDERMCVLDVVGLLARCIGLAWHRERQPSPAARAFMELARSVCGPLGAASAA
jgi:DNA-binding transcriptional LysR family regulator